MSKKRKNQSEPPQQQAGPAAEDGASEAGSISHLSLAASDCESDEEACAESSASTPPENPDAIDTDDVARAAAELASRQTEFVLAADETSQSAVAAPESAEEAESASADRVSGDDDPQGDDAQQQAADDSTDEGSDTAGDALAGEIEEQARQAGVQEEIRAEQVIEAILFAADTPLPLPKIVAIIGVGSAREVRKHIDELNKKYAQINACFRIEKIANGYQMLTLPVYNNWLKRLRQSRQDSRLSPAAMETLAVVAYKQPVVRAEIEAVRGVSAGEMLNRLRELGLIKIVGRAEDVGRPMLYGTTKRFLEVFGLGGLEDLPLMEGMS